MAQTRHRPRRAVIIRSLSVEALNIPADDPDLPLRRAAIERARELSEQHDGLVPLDFIRQGFQFEGQRVSFGSLMKGIHRGAIQQGAAALTLTTSVNDPYLDRDGPTV